MEDETVEEFRKKLKESRDKVINFQKQPEPEVKQKKQRHMTSAEARAKSGWRRGLELGGSII
jgi:hypothetical protein